MFVKLKFILFVAWISGAVFAAAQTPQQTPSEPSSPAPQTVTPTQNESSTSQQYEGPSIISRDPTLIGERGGKLLDFRVWAAITGVYDTGIVPVSTDATGKITNVPGSYGAEGTFGASGSRQWKKDSLSLDYNGTYRHYFNNRAYDGTDQFLSLRYGRFITRHILLDIKENAGTSKLANGAYTYLPLTAIDLQATPTNDLFDSRLYYSDSRVSLIWQKTARLSFSVSGEGYLVRRANHALAGLNGFSGGGDIAYRLTRRQTVSLSYTYSNYNFQRAFGDAQVQTAALGYSIGIARRWDASFAAGGTHAQTRGLQTIHVDPAIIAIIGVPTITTTFNTAVNIPYGSASIIRRFSRSALSLNALTGISPGNGVYLTSRQNVASASYSYVGLRRWTMGASFAFAQLSTVGQSNLGKYDNYQTGIGTTYRIAPQLHLEFRYDYRHYSANGSFYFKDSSRFSLGLAWSPGEIPLAIW